MTDAHTLPPNLPAPIDDGAYDHLTGQPWPALALPGTDGRPHDLAALPGRTVIYAYPKTAHPDQPMPDDWDLIPGARGCTPRSCGFRDHHAELRAAGARVFGLSVQATAYQREAAGRLHLPFPLLSDAAGDLTRALRLPTFAAGGETLLRRVTLIVRDGVIEWVFYPVFPPDRNAGDVLTWLGNHPT
ncbi:peroxiredoxin [Deinococcus sp. MIMF12]|uniref:Peroxiredoxin n=1 Tax=Deinococcus rhizophilus TaxID=3049544 RepID=A0ABT7JHN9_9DEIO|nr:peroxiredoxin [Deinococcus rhizophilus]MDL2344579.1 peroxiredoxin [Deinococcus rhizophilus]